MKYSDTRAEVFKAFVATKKELEPLISSTESEFKTKKGQTIKFSYAELSHIYNNVDEIMTKYGATISHDTYTENRQNFCNTIIMHESGEFIESGYLFYDEARDGYGAPDMKGNNAMFTTMKRISLMSTLGIASEKESESAKPDPPHTQAKKKWQEAPPIEGQLLEAPPEPEPEPQPFTEDLKNAVVWSNPTRQGKLLKLLHEIGQKHGVDDLAIFDRLQVLYKTSYDMDHMPNRALDKYIAICETTLSSGKNPMMKSKEEWGHKNEAEPESRESKFLQNQ